MKLSLLVLGVLLCVAVVLAGGRRGEKGGPGGRGSSDKRGTGSPSSGERTRPTPSGARHTGSHAHRGGRTGSPSSGESDSSEEISSDLPQTTEPPSTANPGQQ